MQITSVNNLSHQPMGGGESFAKMKQLFESLGSALDTGNLSNAKEALAQLQKNAPAHAGNENNPISAKMEKLSTAVDSGDLKAAQDAYADIKQTMAQGPPAGGRRAGGPGGPPRHGAPPSGAKNSSGANDSSSSDRIYDKKDTNQDGTVSWEEELAYSLKHPEEATKTSTTAKIGGDREGLDVTV